MNFAPKKVPRWIRAVAMVWLWGVCSFSVPVSDVQGPRFASGHRDAWSSGAQVRRVSCSTPFKVETANRPGPVLTKLEVPAVAKGAVADTVAGNAIPRRQNLRFSEIPSLVRLVYCMVRWGSLASCRVTI